jgi:hypothetical protein
MTDPRKLTPGLLVLGPWKNVPDAPLDTVWATTRVAKGKATLIALIDGRLQAEITLKGDTVPEGWRALDTREVARAVA